MDESKTPELTVDCEFRDLIRPLLKDEYRHLEAALLADGCREPITVWKGIIVDGHNRYEICRRLGIPFEVRERHFDNREEAIIWICANQLGRRNISDETRRYLIGKRYEAEKVIAGRRNYSGWNQYRKREQSGDLPYEVIEPDAQQEDPPPGHQVLERLSWARPRLCEDRGLFLCFCFRVFLMNLFSIRALLFIFVFSDISIEN